MERLFKKELDAGKTVNLKIDVGYPAGGGVRPNEFNVVALIGDEIKKFKFKQ